MTQHPAPLGAVGGGRLLQGLVELAVGRQQDWDPLDLHSRDAWGPGEGQGSERALPPGKGSGIPPATAPEPATGCATFHVHLGGLHDLLVDHKVGELSEKDGTGVDEDGVVEQRGLQREGGWA